MIVMSFTSLHLNSSYLFPVHYNGKKVKVSVTKTDSYMYQSAQNMRSSLRKSGKGSKFLIKSVTLLF